MSFKRMNISCFVIFIFLIAVNPVTANDKAIELEKACNNGYAKACANLAYCLLYTSDAADDLTRVDLGGRRIIKKRY